jgi:predicted O-linked N-acetylglucosamine transferase (SPINDLY family)
LPAIRDYFMPYPPPSSRNAPCPCGSNRRYKHCHGVDPADVGTGASELDPVGHRAARQQGSDAEPRSDPVAPSDDSAEAHFYAGSQHLAARRHDDALHHLFRADALAPGNLAVLNNLGLALQAVGRMAEAERLFRRSLERSPRASSPLANLAQNLYLQKKYADALACFDRLVGDFDVADAAIWANRGVSAAALGRFAVAASSFEAAIDRNPTAADVRLDYGALLLERGDFEGAAREFQAARLLSPGDLRASSGLLLAWQHLADWGAPFHELRAEIVSRIATSSGPPRKAAVTPFHILTLVDDPELHCSVAKAFADGGIARGSVRSAAAGAAASAAPPVRIGFASRDLREHPVGRLVADLIEKLDPTRFTVLLYHFRDCEDAVTRRLRSASSVYRQLSEVPPDDCVARIRADGVDVLVDLDGYTGRPLTEVFSKRAAPAQVNYLGFTGTMGSPAYDYLLTDAYCVPPSSARFFTETLVYLDPCYLPCGPSHVDSVDVPTRAEYGLAEEHRVVCAMGGLYKVTPEMFDLWLRALAANAKAILWMRETGPAVRRRLCDAARERGIGDDRLIFAPMEPVERYVARFRLADIFVDTYPFGSHTTVRDALRAGLPVLTVAGRSFASRASASQACAAGQAQLVARDVVHYEELLARCIDDRPALRAASEALQRQDFGSRMARHVASFERAIEHIVKASCPPPAGAGR